MTVDTAAIHFNNSANPAPTPDSNKCVTFAIRTDALHATDLLVSGLADLTDVKSGAINASKAVKNAYRDWGRDVLESFARNLDYKQYGLDGETRALNVRFFDAPDLAKRTIENAEQMNGDGPAPFLISLDDMITREDGSKYPEIAFSRLFSLDGREEISYVERPGHAAIEYQLENIAEQLKAIHAETGQRVPMVLLEDNVRRAKMLNWVIDRMEDNGVFKHGELIGISSSFCNAKTEELNKIVFEGKVIPVMAAETCSSDWIVDVATTRDLLFDGFVTEYRGTIGRLPGIFMDVATRFKIAPERKDAFRREIINANIRFCDAIEKEFGTTPPIAWFDGGEILSKIFNCPLETPMTDILKRTMNGLQLNGNDNTITEAQKRVAIGPVCYGL